MPNEFTFTIPKYAGYFSYGGLVMHMYKKPNWFQQLNYRVCFGWIWTDG